MTRKSLIETFGDASSDKSIVSLGTGMFWHLLWYSAHPGPTEGIWQNGMRVLSQYQCRRSTSYSICRYCILKHLVCGIGLYNSFIRSVLIIALRPRLLRLVLPHSCGEQITVFRSTLSTGLSSSDCMSTVSVLQLQLHFGACKKNCIGCSWLQVHRAGRSK